MEKNDYIIQYLPSFNDELNEIIYYITYILKNKKAAERLINNLHTAIIERSKSPKSYEVYKGNKVRKHDWFRIYVRNYTIFYTVENNVIKIAHIIYSKRNFDKIL